MEYVLKHVETKRKRNCHHPFGNLILQKHNIFFLHNPLVLKALPHTTAAAPREIPAPTETRGCNTKEREVYSHESLNDLLRIVRQFCHCMNIMEYTYANLGGLAYHTPSLHGMPPSYMLSLIKTLLYST